jgi:hypothetical protein
MTLYASGARTDSVFAQARAKVGLEDFLERESVKLVRVGSQMRGPCVLCDGAGERFSVKEDKWRCYGCGQHGDVVDLCAALRKTTEYEAAQWLLGGDVTPSAPRAVKAKPAEGHSSSDKTAAEMWATAKPFAGTLGEKYLLKRGIYPAVVALAAPQLRYHPFAKHHWDGDTRDWVRAPAMVAQVVTAAGPTGGVHVTYLDRATAGKALLDRKKLMWGPQRDADGRPGCAWLIGPDGDGDLVVAEGIETGLSVAALALRKGLPMRVLAALSLDRLQGGIKRDKEGCMDPVRPEPDPSSPAVTWPMGDVGGWPEVMVAVDRDSHEQRVKARTGRGKVCHFLLTGEVRAQMCGRLAVAAWKSAGAPKVRAIAPPPGSDFNDELRRVLALESET